LDQAAGRLKSRLGEYAGVFDSKSDVNQGRRELQIALLDAARPLGISTQSLATEVRGAFHGIEARTIQRGRDDVDIRVRFPKSRRAHVYELEAMRVATPTGDMVPFCEVAQLVETRGASAIRRVNQSRAITVTADVDQTVTNAEQVVATLKTEIEQIESRNPGLRIRFSGNKEETRKSMGSLKRDFAIAVGLIYFMLAALFKSYVQPLIVLTAVPFGLNGAVIGHLLMGYPLTMLSMIGLVALTGIVVNDSLIMVTFINAEIASGKDKFEAVIAGGLRRLRPILLTSLTTILGLAPLMAETSFQAKFLIPMAISISFGLAFATVLTLVVVPANYLIVEDIKALLGRATAPAAVRVPSLGERTS
jgi:multidrug efflux pump subunit AcrB